ncbi:MAG TPA: PQQ-binding-like beta-propeller repeat protein [Terriglobia bacterium]
MKYFNGVVTLQAGGASLTALDAETGRLMWQYTGSSLPNGRGLFAIQDSLFMVEEDGIKQYSLEKPSKNVTDKTIITEVASALISTGDLEGAETLIEKVAREMDPDYPPLRLARARLLLANAKAKGQAPPIKAGLDLANYANLAGRDSEASRGAFDELTRDYGLLWHQSLESAAPGSPQIVGGRLINLGFNIGSGQIIALNPVNGEVAWRQPVQRFVDSVAVNSALFAITGDTNDPTAIGLNRIDAASGERKPIASWNQRPAVEFARIAYASGRVFVEPVFRNFQGSRVQVSINAFDATNGRLLWQKDHPLEATRLLQQNPIGLWMPQGDRFIYSVGHDIWTVAAADGVVIDHQTEEGVIGPNSSRLPVAAGPVYFVNDRREIVAYDAAQKTIRRSPRPEVDTTQLTMRGTLLFGTDTGWPFAFDFQSGFQWKMPKGQGRGFLRLQDTGKRLWTLRDDNVLAAIDPRTGRILRELPILWRPLSYSIIDGRFFASTSDGFAYAIQLPK